MMTQIIQADRDAAEAVAEIIREQIGYIVNVTLNPDGWLVQAFANHRIASTSTLSTPGEGEVELREALGGYSLRDGTLAESINGFVGNLEFYSELPTIGDSLRSELGMAAKIIRILASLSPSPAEDSEK